MAELIVMVGVPGSGKSTYIKQINKDSKYTVISLDDRIEDLARENELFNEKGHIDYNKAFKIYLKDANRLHMYSIKDAFDNEKDIIWDQTNMSVKSRRKIFSNLPKCYTDISAVVFSLTDVEWKKRFHNRKQLTGKSVPMEVVEQMFRNFEMPTKEEGFTKIKVIKE